MPTAPSKAQPEILRLSLNSTDTGPAPCWLLLDYVKQVIEVGLESFLHCDRQLSYLRLKAGLQALAVMPYNGFPTVS